MDPILLSVVAFVAVAGLVAAVAFLVGDNGANKTEDRLEVITGKKAKDDGDTQSLIREGVDGLTGWFGSIMQRLPKLQLLIEQADSPIKADMFLGITAGMFVVGVVGSMVAAAPAPVYPVAGLGLACFPLMWLLWRRKGRFNAFAKQLPDALELVARALRSGHSLASGLHVVVEEMPAPISTEFAITYEEQNLGVPIEEALKNMLDRMPNMDLKLFVTAVAIQRQAGGDMSEILDKIGYLIRERFKILGQVMALTGEGRISGIVLMALPIALFFAVYFLNRDYVMLLFTEPLGRKMIAVAAVLQVLGAVAIKKIVNIKV